VIKQCPDFYPVSTTSANGLDTSYNAADSRHVLKASLDDVRADFYAVGTCNEAKDQWNKLETGWMCLRGSDTTGGCTTPRGPFLIKKREGGFSLAGSRSLTQWRMITRKGGPLSRPFCELSL